MGVWDDLKTVVGASTTDLKNKWKGSAKQGKNPDGSVKITSDTSLVNIMYNAVNAGKQNAIQGGTASFLTTPTGKDVQKEGTRQTINEYIRNPIVMVVGGMIVLTLLNSMMRR